MLLYYIRLTLNLRNSGWSSRCCVCMGETTSDNIGGTHSELRRIFSKQERSVNDCRRIDDSRCWRTDGKILSLQHLQRSQTGFDSFDTKIVSLGLFMRECLVTLAVCTWHPVYCRSVCESEGESCTLQMCVVASNKCDKHREITDINRSNAIKRTVLISVMDVHRSFDIREQSNDPVLYNVCGLHLQHSWRHALSEFDYCRISASTSFTVTW
jgi:hypothetical protein